MRAKRANLTFSFLQSVLLEIQRMCPVVPLGVPHGTLEEVETVGQWTIPKGSMLMVNHWAMNYNPEHYKDPQIFKPLRFLENEIKPMPFQVSMNSECSCEQKSRLF